MEGKTKVVECSSKGLRESLAEHGQSGDVIICVKKNGAENMMKSIVDVLDDSEVNIEKLEIRKIFEDGTLSVGEVLRVILENCRVKRLTLTGFSLTEQDVMALYMIVNPALSKVAIITLTDCELESEAVKESIYAKASEKRTMVLIQRSTYRKDACGKKATVRHKHRTDLPYNRPATMRIL